MVYTHIATLQKQMAEQASQQSAARKYLVFIVLWTKWWSRKSPQKSALGERQQAESNKGLPKQEAKHCFIRIQ